VKRLAIAVIGALAASVLVYATAYLYFHYVAYRTSFALLALKWNGPTASVPMPFPGIAAYYCAFRCWFRGFAANYECPFGPVRGLTEGRAFFVWRRGGQTQPFNIRVILVTPSEVLTGFYSAAGLPQAQENPTKLHGDDIAHAVQSALEMDDRGFITELTVFATNPKA